MGCMPNVFNKLSCAGACRVADLYTNRTLLLNRLKG